MLINPSIYNGYGRLNSNYDPFSDRRFSAPNISTSNVKVTNSLTQSINQAMNNAVSGFTSQFKANLKGINDSAKALGNPKSDAYQGRTASNASKAFSVSVSAGAATGANTLSVTQMATKQSNVSQAVASNDLKYGGSSFSFTVEKEGKSTSLDFTVNTGENISSAMNRFAKAINTSGAGVKAKVTEDEYGFSTMTLESTTTGKDKGFNLSGSFADTFRMNDRQTAGTDLEYELNGNSGTSDTNTIASKDGKTLINVNETTETEQTFEVSEDSSGLAKAITSFAKAYNAFVESSKDTNNPLVQSLGKQFKTSVGRSLEKMNLEGIAFNQNGEMEVDEKQLKASIQDNYDEVKSAMMKFDSFAKNIERKTENALNAPVSRYLPDMENRASAVKPFIYNYDRFKTLSNLNNFNTQGTIIDISL